MMKHLIVLVAAGLTAWCCGCSTCETEMKQMEDGISSDATPRQAESSRDVQFGNAILKAIQEENYSDFIAHMKDSPSEKMSAEEFKKTRENMERQFGTITAFHYLTSLKTPVVENLVWIVSFERKSEEHPDQMIEQQLLFRILLGREEGKLHVIGMGFL